MATPKPLQATLMATPDDTETQLYEALHAGDLERLMAVWVDDDEAVCIHPGSGRLTGLRAIRESFDQMFRDGSRLDVRPMSVRRVSLPGCEVHHVVERVRVGEPGQEGAARIAFMLATNIYVKTPQGWRLQVHHASLGTGREHHEGEAASTLH
jgi:uncharacterized protein (TIGR02246 family)